MIPTPDYVRAAVARHHRPRWRLVGASGEWPITEGSVELSRTSRPTALVQGRVAQLTGTATTVAAEFQPFGSTATLTWGVDPWADQITIAEGLPVVVTSVSRPDSIVSVKLQDPAAIISKHTWAPATPPPLPGSVLDAVRQIVQRTFPSHTVLDPTGFGAAAPPPEDWVQSDPWAGVLRCAEVAGLTPAYSSATEVTLYREPATSGPTVDHLTVDEHIIDYSITYERAYSRVMLQYENVTGTWDATTGPLVGLPPVTYYEKRDGTTSQADADAQAFNWATRAAGRVAQLELRCVPRPWLQPGDRVGITLLNNTISVGIIDSITVPFNGDPMRIRMRNSDYIGPAEY